MNQSYLCDDYVYSTESEAMLDTIRNWIRERTGPQKIRASSEVCKKGRKTGSPGKKFEHLTGLSNLGKDQRHFWHNPRQYMLHERDFTNALVSIQNFRAYMDSHTIPMKRYFLEMKDPLSPISSAQNSPKFGPVTRKAVSEKQDV